MIPFYQDYGARIYHTGIARFISADPLIVNEKKYAFLSPYQFASNTPITAVDLDGLEPASVVMENPIVKKIVTIVLGEKYIKDVVSGFYRQNRGKPGHYHGSIDVGVPVGTNLYAVGTGTIIHTSTPSEEEKWGYGKFILVQHDNGVYSMYAHLSEIIGKEGDTIEQGQFIGKTGKSGTKAPHLHFEFIIAENIKKWEELFSGGIKGKGVKRFNPVKFEEVEKNTEGKKWLDEQGASKTIEQEGINKWYNDQESKKVEGVLNKSKKNNESD